MCRITSHLGAQVIGVDQYFPRYERVTKKGRAKLVGRTDPDWTFVQRDLLQEGALDEKTFPNDTFDFVYCYDFFDDDEAMHNAASVTTMRDNQPEQFGKVFTLLCGNIVRTMRENAIFVLGKDVFEKKNDQLSLRKRLIRPRIS